MITDNDLLKINKAKQGFEFKKKSIINKLPERSVHQHSPSQPRVWLILPRRKGKNPKESCAKLVAKFPQRPESVSAAKGGTTKY